MCAHDGDDGRVHACVCVCGVLPCYCGLALTRLHYTYTITYIIMEAVPLYSIRIR